MYYYNSISITKGSKVTINDITKRLSQIDYPLQSGFVYEDWPILKPNEDKFTFKLAHWGLIEPCLLVV